MCRPRALDAGAYTQGMQNTISPVYGAPPSVTAGAVNAMEQAQRQLEITQKYM